MHCVCGAQNRRLQRDLTMALTGNDSGISTEMPAAPLAADDPDSSASEDDEPQRRVEDDNDDDNIITANEVAGKDFPLAHRLLDKRGFVNVSYLESVLHVPHDVCLLLQKEEGVGLSISYQMMQVLEQVMSAPKLQVVSGFTKQGAWNEVHNAHLPEMFRHFRSIMAEELESRFHVRTTPDAPTLLALQMDPYLDTSEESGVFSGRTATQSLMLGEYKRALFRRMRASTVLRTAPAPAPAPAPASATPPTPAPPLVPAASSARQPPKRPVGVLSIMCKPAKTLAIDAAGSLSEPEKVVMAEISKFEAISRGVVAEGERSRFFDSKARMFDQKAFWYEHRFDLPVHYRTFVGEVGSAKAASSNVETVFSGIGGMLAKATTMDPDLAANYTILHHNFMYAFLEPTDEEVVEAYTKEEGEEPIAAARDPESGESEESAESEESDSERESEPDEIDNSDFQF